MTVNENNEVFEEEYDSLNDVAEFQENMYNPGHYIATGRVPPTVSAPGNATPLVVLCFFATALFLAFGLFLFFSDVSYSGPIESDIWNKIISLVIMLGISLFFFILGVNYFKKAKLYYKEKAALESELIDDTVEDKLWQRTCPECGKSHDIDYPKCPYCKFDYLNR